MGILSFFRNRGKEVRSAAHNEAAPPPLKTATVISVGGGKGGVGKSMVAANLGVLLASRGKRVLMVDADLGAANLHTFFGVMGRPATLSGLLKGEIDDLNKLVLSTGIDNLYLISGCNDSLDAAGCKRDRLAEAITTADYDYVILDIGPGTSFENLDLFLSCDTGVLVTTPEPTSIENSYRFIKCLLLRRMRGIIASERDTRLKALLTEVFSGEWKSSIKSVADIVNAVRRLDPERGAALTGLMAELKLFLLVNQAKRPEDLELGAAMSKACRGYFAMGIGSAGSIPYDEDACDAIRGKRPVLVSHPGSMAAVALTSALGSVLGSEAGYEPARNKKVQ